MKFILTVLVFFLTAASAYSQNLPDHSKSVEEKWSRFSPYSVKELERWVGLDSGRLKPLLTYAREQILFITGHYTHEQTSALGWIVAGSFDDSVVKYPLINIRDTDLRTALGYGKNQRWVSAESLKLTSLLQWAEPLMSKASTNQSFLEPQEKNILEVYRQLQTVEELRSGQLLQNFLGPSADVFHQTFYAHSLPKSLNESFDPSAVWPSELDYSSTRVEAEIMLTKSQPFMWAGVLFLIAGLIMALAKTKWSYKLSLAMSILSLMIITAGFVARVGITGFAPVTNMYGTMIWVSLGLSSVSAVFIYKNFSRLLCVTFVVLTGALLIFTESVPLVLSPHLDPIVAVLRSNFWLTIHVLTIVMSYALLASATVLAHILIILRLRENSASQDSASQSLAMIENTHHLMYKLTQIGVFTLSVGIVLGGIWADYSWGRFWGWDPKETWALIADLGFLAVLHARYIKKFDLFFESVAIVAAFLLVIMAWYGVNFILAAGLHSYGFSSGGATIVSVFVALEVLFITVSAYLFLQKSSVQSEITQ